MNLRKLIFTENACYKAGRTIDVKGIMVHSTGANNPWLKRYVGPDDGVLGHNPYDNHWNQYYPDGRAVCPHAFIGKTSDGSIATYQVLPWMHRAWHCGGRANDTHISFEICEDSLTDLDYFTAVYKEAVELCAYLCNLYGATYMNDPEEGTVLFEFLSGGNKDYAIQTSKHRDIYLSCFTSEIDQLTMWSLYGKEVKGCCLVLSPDYFDCTVSGGVVASIMDMANNTNYNCFPTVTF